jgi:hypothetical protein
MARVTKGIQGGFSGAVGTVVGSSWRGIDYMRSHASYPKGRTYSLAQLDQQRKFGLVNSFTKTLTDLLRTTYKLYAKRQSGVNSATSYLLQKAIAGSSPHFELDYSKVLISRGNLLGARNAGVRMDADGIITFTWINNAGAGGAKTSDRAIIVAYCPELKQSRYAITTASRSSSTVSMPAAAFSGYPIHTWLGFIAENEKAIANSVYAGALGL